VQRTEFNVTRAPKIEQKGAPLTTSHFFVSPEFVNYLAIGYTNGKIKLIPLSSGSPKSKTFVESPEIENQAIKSFGVSVYHSQLKYLIAGTEGGSIVKFKMSPSPAFESVHQVLEEGVSIKQVLDPPHAIEDGHKHVFYLRSKKDLFCVSKHGFEVKASYQVNNKHKSKGLPLTQVDFIMMEDKAALVIVKEKCIMELADMYNL